MALDFGILEAMGDSIKNVGSAAEDGIGAVGAVIRKTLEEFTKTGVTVEDAAAELAEHAIGAVSSVGGDVEAAAVKIIDQTVQAAGELGGSTASAAEKAGSGVINGAAKLGQGTLGAVKSTVAAAVPGRDTSDDPD